MLRAARRLAPLCVRAARCASMRATAGGSAKVSPFNALARSLQRPRLCAAMLNLRSLSSSAAAPLSLEETQRRVLAVVRQCAKTDAARASLATPWQRMGLDSLDVVELMIALEDEFQLEIPDAVADAAESAAALADYIHAQHNPGEEAPAEQVPVFDSEAARDEYVRTHGPV